MSGYIHGSSAIERQPVPAERQQRNVKKQVVRRKTISAREKLLYLAIVFACCALATVIIFRYAQIYELNSNIHKVESEISQLEYENMSLKLEVSKLENPERIIELGKQYGLLLPE